jgi:hypothetical protein
VFTGGLSEGGVAARAIAVIGESVVRSNLIKMKFDRLTQTYAITDLNQTDTISSALVTGSRKQFPLTWGPDVRIGQTSVTINGVPVLRDTYTVAIVKSTALGYTSYSGSITFDTAPTAGAEIIVNYVKDISLLDAADRVQYYYNPVSGQLGKDLAQLMTGIDYGGVQVGGLGFEISGGWGNRPYAAEGWDVYDKTFTDFIETTAANQHSFTLNYVPANGTELNFYFIHDGADPIRLDDPAYGTVVSGTWTPLTEYAAGDIAIVQSVKYVSTIDQTSSTSFNDDLAIGNWRVYNANAIMQTVTADGNTTVFTIPSNFTVASGDTIIIRQSTSDGSVKLQDTDYDTILTGGDMAYSTAIGISPEDIVIDGDGFVTPTSSPAPEEVVPGQVVDAVAIKVFDRPSSGNANVKIDNHYADGVTATYEISQQPNSPQAVIVKQGDNILTPGDDYTVDYRNRSVTLNAVPDVDTLISIFSISFSGSNILDIDHFVGDGTTTEFITHAHWQTAFTTLVYLDGNIVTPLTFKTDNSYDNSNVVGIRFQTAPAAGQLINYIIVSGDQPTFTITRTERVNTNGDLTYTLQYPIGKLLLDESKMIVRADQTILRAPNSSYYTIGSNRLTYSVSQAKAQANTMQVTDVVVVADGDKLQFGVDYTVDLSGLTIKISKTVYKKYSGKQLSINLMTFADYTYNPTTGEITFKQSYTSDNVVEVFSSYQHDSLDIQRTEFTATSTLNLVPDTKEFYDYKGIFGGRITLDRAVKDDNYVWVTRNGTLLTPSVDYKLLDDRSSIQLLENANVDDTFGLLTFGNNVLPVGIAYMQFKDMLNRVTFKRLNANKQTRLVRDVYYNDTIIELEDTSVLGVPNPLANRPGVIEIRGERIEYFTITGNFITNLRRGTLGTGTPNRHKAGSYVQDIGGSETIPYFESDTIDTAVSDGSNIVPLTLFTPMADVIASGHAYTKTSDWSYLPGFVSTIPAGYIQADDIEVFVGGIRLRKKPYRLYDVTLGPDSPVADAQYDAEYAVDGITGAVRLTNAVPAGTQVVVVKRTGVEWDSAINIQYDNTKIAKFLKDQPGSWYTDARQYGTTTPVTLDSTIYTFDSTNYTFDKE